MNIYFACSITGGRGDQHIYQKIVNALLDDGHHVPTALLATPHVMTLEEIVDPKEVYRRDIAWIDASDLLIAEVSTPSHGVGYEICYALNSDKPVICLYKQDVKVSKMLLGNPDANLITLPYHDLDQGICEMHAHLERLEKSLCQ